MAVRLVRFKLPNVIGLCLTELFGAKSVGWGGFEPRSFRFAALPDSNLANVTILSLTVLFATEVVGWGRFELPTSSV